MMSESDVAGDVHRAPGVEGLKAGADAAQPRRAPSPVARRSAAAPARSPAIMLAPAAQAFAASASIFGSQKTYKFMFVNHVTTNPFFTPTQYGIADACTLLGCTSQWTGSASSNVPQMVTAFNSGDHRRRRRHRLRDDRPERVHRADRRTR